MSASQPSQDIRDLLSMNTKAAYAMAAFYAVTCLVCAIASIDGVDPAWVPFASAAILSASVVLLLAAPGDPLDLRATVALMACGPAASGLMFLAMPVPMTGRLQTWPIGMAVIVYTFMCVRGRTSAAWVGLLATVGVSTGWTAITGQGALFGLSFSIINVAPMLMATFFAFTIRPLGAAIFALRRQSTVRIASEAAASAALEERDVRLASLDALARPLLQRIAEGPDPSEDDLLACRLLEAELRDSLRARGLVDPELARAARAARGRGVEVILLDDRGAPLPDAVRGRIVADAAASLDAVAAGSVTVRVLPAGRPTAATILLDDRDGSARRLEYDTAGARLTPV